MRFLFAALLLSSNTVAFSPPKALTTGLAPRSTNTRAIRPSYNTRLHNLNRSYLDSINEEEERRNFRNDRSSGGRGNNSGYFNYGGENNNNKGGGVAVRPNEPNRSYGVGGWGNNGNNGGGSSKIVSIKQPQDLLDFVIEDERLSVVKVYASWCKTCQVFDIRYRKLASQIGDTPNSKGLVRFSEMQFDDPNNEEMCRLLNATKLPYILIYKGSRGKIMDFQCGPSDFQQLINAVNEHADATLPNSVAAIGQEVSEVEEEQEWRVQQQQQQQQQQDQKNDGIVKQKDQEITRLYKELSNLRKQYDEKIRNLKEEHKYETGELRKEMERQAKQYEEERTRLNAQIKQLTQDMLEREKAYRAGNDGASEQLRRDLKDKEKQYENTLNSMTYKIADLEESLFKTKNELKYNTEASEREKEELSTTIALLEEEQSNLVSKNKELEKELAEDKRLVVESTEQASRVLKQLEEMKINKEEEAARLNARIRELEQEIANIYADNNGGYDMSAEMERLKNEYQQERELMAARIIELESNQGEWQPGGSMELEQERERVLELEETITSIKRELDQRDRLLRTSNKATDILLDQMEAQKRDYEKELARTAELTNELEAAIDKREIELRELKAQFSSLERIAEGLKARDMRRISEGVSGRQGDMSNDELLLERDMRLAAEEEVNRLREMVNQQGADDRQGWRDMDSGSKPKKSFFDQMFGERSNAGSWDEGFGDGFGFGRSQESMRGSATPKGQEPKDEYALLNDVLAPDEVSPRESMPGWGDYGGSDNTQRDSTYFTPTPSAVNEEPVRVPTPQQEFERRLAENPIVPAGAFGGSRPTATFFRTPSPQNSNTRDEQYAMPSGSFENQPPTLPPAASFMPRPASPAPRVQARKGISDNIYAGAGSAVTSSTPPSPAVPSPSAYEVPAQVPTPQLEFERRIAENPIVPSGAFGGSKPTADFFRKSTAPPPQSGQFDGGDQDEQSKWQSLDETEKKRVAAKAYEAFEKQLADRRGQDQRPRQGMGGLGSRGAQNANPARTTLQDDGRGKSTMGSGPPTENTSRTTIQKEDQLQIERKKHTEMVQQAARAKQQHNEEDSSSQSNNDKIQNPLEKIEDKVKSQSNQTTQEMTRSAAEASSKRAKKAEDASAELKRQNQMKAEAIRREQNERRAKEEAAVRQRNADQKREEQAQATRIKARREAAEKEKLSNELKARKMSEAKIKAEEQKLLMEKQRQMQAAETKDKEERMRKLDAEARDKIEQQDRARVERQTRQARKEQAEADARARAVEERIRLEEEKLKANVKNSSPDDGSSMPNNAAAQKSRSGEGFQKSQERTAVAKPPQRSTGNSLRDLADSGKRGKKDSVESSKRMKDVVDSVANEAKYKVVVLKEGNKSELEGPLKDLLGKPNEEAARRKADNY